MYADNLQEIGHKGFTVDAQPMAAVLFDFATHADYRAAVKKALDGLTPLFGEYQAALKRCHTVPPGLAHGSGQCAGSAARSGSGSTIAAPTDSAPKTS